MNPLNLVKLTALMERTSGCANVKVGLVDGPVATRHPDLAAAHLREIRSDDGATCTRPGSAACVHGTFVAGILFGKRNSSAPAICPDCTVVIRPIFAEATTGSEQMPTAEPEALATAIVDCIDAGARVINLSLAVAQPSANGDRAIEHAIGLAVRRGVLIVAASGNQGTIGSSAITRHPWVIPVVACDLMGRPMNQSNIGGSIGRRGLLAPGYGITSIGAEGQPLTLAGTSVSAPFVTGAIALLWSVFADATALQIKFAVSAASSVRRASVVPPLLDAGTAYRSLLAANATRLTA